MGSGQDMCHSFYVVGLNFQNYEATLITRRLEGLNTESSWSGQAGSLTCLFLIGFNEAHYHPKVMTMHAMASPLSENEHVKPYHQL